LKLQTGVSLVHCEKNAPTIRPGNSGGTLVFKGTRVPVQSLFDHLKAGDSIEVFLDGFPSVKRSQCWPCSRKWKPKFSPTPDVRILLDENLNWRLAHFLPDTKSNPCPRIGWPD